MKPNYGVVVAEAWEMVMTLEGPDDLFDWLDARLTGRRGPYISEGPRIKTGEWRGERYWKVWNFRTGRHEWRKR